MSNNHPFPSSLDGDPGEIKKQRQGSDATFHGFVLVPRPRQSLENEEYFVCNNCQTSDVTQREPKDQTHALQHKSGVLPGSEIRTLSSIACNLRHRHSALVPAREKALVLRAQITYEREVYSHKERFHSESAKALLAFLQSKDAGRQPGLASVSGDELEQRLRNDGRALEEQNDKLRNLEKDLSSIESQMQQRESSLSAAMDDILRMFEQKGLLDNADRWLSHEFETGETPLLDPPIDAHPLIADYEKCIQAVEVADQHLQELEDSHRAEMVTRDLLEDQGETSDTSAEVFESAYIDERLPVERELKHATNAAAIAKAACLEHSLDVQSIHQSLPPYLLELLGERAEPESELNPDQGPQAQDETLCTFPSPPGEVIMGREASTPFALSTTRTGHTRLETTHLQNCHAIISSSPISGAATAGARIRSKIESWMQSTEDSSESTGQPMYVSDGPLEAPGNPSDKNCAKK